MVALAAGASRVSRSARGHKQNLAPCLAPASHLQKIAATEICQFPCAPPPRLFATCAAAHFRVHDAAKFVPSTTRWRRTCRTLTTRSSNPRRPAGSFGCRSPSSSAWRSGPSLWASRRRFIKRRRRRRWTMAPLSPVVWSASRSEIRGLQRPSRPSFNPRRSSISAKRGDSKNASSCSRVTVTGSSARKSWSTWPGWHMIRWRRPRARR